MRLCIKNVEKGRRSPGWGRGGGSFRVFELHIITYTGGGLLAYLAYTDNIANTRIDAGAMVCID